MKMILWSSLTKGFEKKNTSFKQQAQKIIEKRCIYFFEIVTASLYGDGCLQNKNLYFGDIQICDSRAENFRMVHIEINA